MEKLQFFSSHFSFQNFDIRENLARGINLNFALQALAILIMVADGKRHSNPVQRMIEHVRA